MSSRSPTLSSKADRFQLALTERVYKEVALNAMVLSLVTVNQLELCGDFTQTRDPAVFADIAAIADLCLCIQLSGCGPTLLPAEGSLATESGPSAAQEPAMTTVPLSLRGRYCGVSLGSTDGHKRLSIAVCLHTALLRCTLLGSVTVGLCFR